MTKSFTRLVLVCLALLTAGSFAAAAEFRSGKDVMPKDK